MRRLLILLGCLVVLLFVDAGPLLAQEAKGGTWPPLGVPFSRGGGAYLSPWKIAAFWLVFLCWVRTTDWVSQDGQAIKARYMLWNPIVFFSFLAALLLLWILPWFAAGIVLLIIGYASPLSAYIVYRNRLVKSANDKVLTARHIRRYLGQRLGKFGVKVEGADDDPRDAGPDIKLSPMGAASERDNNINMLNARQSPGFVPARVLIDDALKLRATHVMLDYTAESVGVRYQIDGMWMDREAMDRESGDAMLEVLKGIAALKPADRRSRQSGQFGCELGKDKYTCKLTSQGTQTGERALLLLEPKKLNFKTREELGMRAKMSEQIEEILQQPGMFIFCSLPGNGLTTTMDVVLSTTDRFIRNFVTVTDVDKPDRDIENIHITTYSRAAGESAAAVLPKLMRTYPDVVVLRDVSDLETLTILCEQPGEDRLVVTSTRAKEAVEAPLRLMALKIPPADLAGVVTAVLNVRLIRVLCDKCKEGYAPPPEVLKQLGLPPGRVEALYRPPTQPIDPKHPERVCDQCQGSGFYGRTGIFELLIITDELRAVLAKTPKLENLRAAARKAKHRSLQEEGVLLVARGITSLPELIRVLKQ